MTSRNTLPTPARTMQAVNTAAAAPAPKISAGMASGSTISTISIPALRSPSVSAAPTPPSRLRIGVPNNRDTNSTGSSSAGRPSSRPSSGAPTTSGAPLIVQWPAALAAATATPAPGASSSCSSEPSAWSAAYSGGIDSIAASSAQTQTTPGAINLSTCGSGPTPSGNRLAATRKNATGSSASVRRRQARRRSRW